MHTSAHLEAAELHEAAAKTHRSAADQFGKGDLMRANELAEEAVKQAERAWDISKHASEKSGEHKKLHG